MTFSSCNFLGNMAKSGGAGQIWDSRVYFESCNFIGNVAKFYDTYSYRGLAGGLEIQTGVVTIRSCIFSENTDWIMDVYNEGVRASDGVVWCTPVPKGYFIAKSTG